ncbi:MAG: D-alanyl-D-alanine carboxypeptidase [Candidatus Daviesbacteria bacterium]|nr:D-alanyl-D-alanine carboxypeptidase [Candidatus Daviesbacteria bacterium]
MKYYLYSAILVLFAIVVAIAAPFLVDFTDTVLISARIPQNNAQVAGIQQYNIAPASQGFPVPGFSARAILIKDLSTGTILYQKDSNIPLPIASTTKIMTALVASEYFQPDSVLTVGESANMPGSKVGLNYGENLSFRSLLYGMLLSSGNDAAYAIAENFPGRIFGFVSAMNKKALELNLRNTRFDNPAGFDSRNQYSSAEDLAKITEEALKNTQLAIIFATEKTNIVSLNKKYIHQLVNLNKLLSSVNGVLGIKTGTTEEAKENLVTLVERDKHRVLLVVLGSNDRFGETTGLIDWTYKNFTWPDSGIVR